VVAGGRFYLGGYPAAGLDQLQSSRVSTTKFTWEWRVPSVVTPHLLNEGHWGAGICAPQTNTCAGTPASTPTQSVCSLAFKNFRNLIRSWSARTRAHSSDIGELLATQPSPKTAAVPIDELGDAAFVCV
jgi:hypothetical protein